MSLLRTHARRRPPALLLALALLAALTPALRNSPPSAVAANAAAKGTSGGYWLAASDGGIFAFGDAKFLGSTGNLRLNKPIVGMAASPSGAGYWLVASDGGIFSFGDAAFAGSTGAIKLNKPIVGMAATPAGRGYWLVASDGGIFSFGDAAFFGSTGAIRLNRPIAGMAATPSGRGYWLVASDGGIFSFGDAKFFGSTGAVKLNQPIAGMASTASGAGYWLVASDGGVFSFGDAQFHGAAPARRSRAKGTRDMVALVPSPTGGGYWQVRASGEVFAFGDVTVVGEMPIPSRELVGMVGVPKRTAGAAPVATTTNPGPRPDVFGMFPNKTWGTSPAADRSGRVNTAVEVGSTLYAGGEFTGMVPPDGTKASAVQRDYLAALDVGTGELLPWNPAPDGPIHALVVSPDGRRLYIAGDFDSIFGQKVRNLVAVDLATGTLDRSFTPPYADATVRAVAAHGDRLYIGGNFETLRLPDGQVAERTQLAALAAGTGALLDWTPPPNQGGSYKGHTGSESSSGNGIVYSVAVSADGALVHAGGDFLRFGGRRGVLTVDAATGAPSAWQAQIDRPVFDLVLSPIDGSTIYTATGGTGGRLFAFDPKGKAAPKWEVRTDGDNVGVVVTPKRLYLLGHYDTIITDDKTDCYQNCPDHGIGRKHLAAFDPITGQLDLDWAPLADTSTGPYAGALGSHHLYVVGEFTAINRKSQPGIAQFPGAS